MTSLARIQPASLTQLLTRILDQPELVAAVRELSAPVLGALIDRVGLEDAGELVALASTEQLQSVFDQDLWRAASPGEDEQFRPERFALWLEIMFEGGEDFLIEQLCALPRDLVTLAVHRLVLVVDIDSLWRNVTEPSEELQRLERALEAPLFEEWEEFRLLARDPAHWDAVWAALLALDRDHHDVLREILEKCCALGSEYIGERGGLYEVLTSEEMLESDVAGEREDRRAAQGFIAPADARGFLELARRGDQLETRDAITMAYFRARASEQRVWSAEDALHERGRSPAALSKLVRLLADAGVVGPAHPKAVAAIPAGVGAANRSRGLARVEDSSRAAAERPMLFLQALVELRLQKPDLFSLRIEELHYLANVLIAGSIGRRPRPLEALEQAIALCNTGLERMLGADRALTRAVELMKTAPADQLFRRGSADGRGLRPVGPGGARRGPAGADV
jgi:hypothetical protein